MPSKDVFEERERKKSALHTWLMSQPQEVLVKSLLVGVVSPHTLETIVKQERKKHDKEQGVVPTYNNLQVNGSVDGVKIGLRVFTTDGRRTAKVIGFEPAPPPATPRVSPRLQECAAGSSSAAALSSRCLAAVAVATPAKKRENAIRGRHLPGFARFAPRLTLRYRKHSALSTFHSTTTR